ncbi:hypothetical protein GX50_05350 [[Emmonsia] crescens]|uniref:Uncharacterized protein n=1 Tax=[Emmonsia] crescens TaxID=73230 RepID=A0A2B7ZFQ7_9EURO|nr:hypothetical protein GX50_05350 [Emmonsia crescens]
MNFFSLNSKPVATQRLSYPDIELLAKQPTLAPEIATIEPRPERDIEQGLFDTSRNGILHGFMPGMRGL